MAQLSKSRTERKTRRRAMDRFRDGNNRAPQGDAQCRETVRADTLNLHGTPQHMNAQYRGVTPAQNEAIGPLGGGQPFMRLISTLAASWFALAWLVHALLASPDRSSHFSLATSYAISAFSSATFLAFLFEGL